MCKPEVPKLAHAHTFCRGVYGDKHRGKTYAHALTLALPVCTCGFRCPNSFSCYPYGVPACCCESADTDERKKDHNYEKGM